MVPPQHDKAKAALEGVVNAGHLTSEVVDGFRALFAKGDQRRELVDVNEIMQGVLESLSSDLYDRQIEPRAELTSKLPHVNGNRSQLQEVMSNLIVNAIEASHGNHVRSDAFEKVWLGRDSYLDSVPGFLELHLLKGTEAEDHTLYSSHTVWQSTRAFEAWTKSEEFRAAHARAGNETTRPLYLEHPKFEGFQVRQTIARKAATA